MTTMVRGIVAGAAERAVLVRRTSLGLLVLMLAGGLTEANSVAVRGTRALGGGGFHLLVSVDNPASVEPNDAWVGIGPDRGMDAETQVAGNFVVDPSRLRMAVSAPGSPHHLCFLGLAETAEWETARVILFLERDPGGAWLVGARLWDDGLASFVTIGPSHLTDSMAIVRRSPRESPETVAGPTPVEFEWRAASRPGARDGSFRLFRAVGESRELVLERTGLENGSQRLDYLRAGVVNAAHQTRGTFGALTLDDITVARTFGPAAP